MIDLCEGPKGRISLIQSQLLKFPVELPEARVVLLAGNGSRNRLLFRHKALPAVMAAQHAAVPAIQPTPSVWGNATARGTKGPTRHL